MPLDRLLGMNSEPVLWSECWSVWEAFKASRSGAAAKLPRSQETPMPAEDYAVLGQAVAGMMAEDADFRAIVIAKLGEPLFGVRR